MSKRILPPAGDRYDPAREQQFRAAVEIELERAFARGEDIEAGRGERIILHAPNGSRWALTASNAGVLTLVAA